MFPFVFLLICALSEASAEILDIPEFRYVDPEADPCEDFYAYTCGNFDKYHPLPHGETSWGHFDILQDEIHDLMKIILKSEAERDESKAVQKAKMAYKSCLDTDYVDKLSLAEVRILEEVKGWPAILQDEPGEFTWCDIGDIVADFGIPMFFTFSIEANMLSSDDNVIYFQRDALANSSSVYPAEDADPYATSIMPSKHRQKDFLDVVRLGEGFLQRRSAEGSSSEPSFMAFIKKVALRLRDVLNTGKTNEAVFTDIEETLVFMQRLMDGGIVEENATVASLSSIINITTLQTWTDLHFAPEELGLDWIEYFKHVFRPTGVEVTPAMKVMHPGTSFLYGILNLLRQTSQKVLKNFVVMRILTYTAADSDFFMREALEEYYRRENFTLFAREDYCLRKILDYPNDIGFAMALTHEYQLYHFNVNNLRGAASMVEDLEETFRAILEEADWIDETSRQNALEKAANMVTLLAYPEFVEEAQSVDEYYQNLKVCAWDHSGNAKRLRAFRWGNNLVELTNGRNRRVWIDSPLKANAFYNRQVNRMLFPVIMLNPIFYRGQDVLDYGRIGAIIGHEITHGYDSEGVKFGKDGTYFISTLWSNETQSNYNNRTQCFIDQYDQYLIEELGVAVDGTYTLNENLADNGGIRIAYRAMKNLQHNETPNALNLTVDQLFFVAFGTMWCTESTNEYLASLNATKYPPTKHRVNGAVSNMKEFAEAFQCKSGTAMNPEKKCSLW